MSPSHRISAPASVVLVLAALLLVGGIVGWSVAFRLGQSRAEREFQKLLSSQVSDAAIEDPLSPRSDGARDAQDRRQDVSGGPAEGARPPASAERAEAGEASGGGTGSYLIPGGRADQDPRTPGFNYLLIASEVSELDEAETARLVDFLGSAGIPIVGVPIDRPGARANNGPVYRLYVLDGVASERFSASAAARASLERRVQELGREWQRERGGTTNFDSPVWEKHRP